MEGVATRRLHLGPMTFSELEVLMEEEIFDYRGDLEITDPHNSNIVLWNGWNEDAVDVFNSLVARGAEVLDAELEDYRRLYRRVPDLPLAVDRRCAYTSPHWAPSLIALNETDR